MSALWRVESSAIARIGEIGAQQTSAFAGFAPASAIFFDLPEQADAFGRIPQSEVI